MRRIVVAVLCVLAGTAEAKRPPSCTCPTDPRLPELRPNRDDTTPPRAPRNVDVWLVRGYGGAPPSISMYGDYARDTAFVRVEIEQTSSMWVGAVTRIENLWLCSIGRSVRGDRVKVWIRAIDIAGNESEPLVVETEIMSLNQQLSTCDASGLVKRPRYGYGGPLALFAVLGNMVYLLYGLLWLAVFGWLIALVATRACATKESAAEPLSRLAAEEVARRNVRWLFAWSAILSVAVVGLSLANYDLIPGVLAPIAFVNVVRLCFARYVLAVLERSDVSAERHGRWLRVTTPGSEYLLRATNADFAAAERASIPRSVVHR